MMALERVPADIRRDGGVARMSDPKVASLALFYISVLVALLAENQRNHGCRHNPCNGKGSYWTLC